jgi:hypothetical protein
MAALAGICQSFDGIPQAIEAAAAWLLLYKPDQLLSLARRDPFKLATPPGNDTAELRAALEASIGSLHPRDADVLHRLAGHSLPFTLAQCPRPLDRGVRRRVRGLSKPVGSAQSRRR